VNALNVPTFDAGKHRDFAGHLAQALARHGVMSFSVIGISSGATLALLQAAGTPDIVQRLVLVSPPLASVQQPQLESKLGDVRAPTLVLVGTRDRSGSREAGHTCRSEIPTCHLLLVYDAGQVIAADRQEACPSSIREFLDLGEGFIVSHESQLIRP
jgi:pimeloyl-ACP methyl ester carboxylesterase